MKPMSQKLKNREKFLKVYADLPLGLRRDIILVLDETEYKGPITWNVAYTEVINNTQLSKKILKDLAELKII